MGNKATKIIPVLSPDVRIQQFSQTEYLVHQRKYRHYVKVSKQVAQLLGLIDGQRNFEAIATQYNLQYEENITPRFISDLLLKNLFKYGLLLNNANSAQYAKKPHYLRLSFIIIGERMLSKITPMFKFLFIPRLTKALFAISFLICSITVFLNFSEIKDFFNMFVPDMKSLITFFGFTFVSVTLHEIGHASAAKFYGAEHGGIGGGFYLFTPVYYADVTDIWRLPIKQRIIVNVAGVYFEMIFCSLLCLISFAISNQYLGVMAFIIFAHSLYNLVPFMRNDGYWVLSDALNIPNLSKSSSNNLVDWIKSVFEFKKYEYHPKRVFLLLYGFINNFFIVFYIVTILFYNPDSVLYFPQNIYAYVLENIVSPEGIFMFSDLKQFIVPLVFYFLMYRLLIRLFKSNYPRLKQTLNQFLSKRLKMAK